MLPPELQPLGYRPYISSASVSDPTFSGSFNGVYSPNRNPNPNLNPNLIFNSAPTILTSIHSTTSNNSTSSRSLKDSRYSPSSFIYNGRIAVALVPCAAFMLDLGGTPVVATLTLGLMFSYILDSLNFKPGAFFGVWFSLIAAQIAFFFSSELFTAFNSIPLGLLAAFLCAEVNFLIGVWSSLQFRWIQIENPSIVLALERLLFACVPLAASSLLAWLAVSAVGMRNVSYYLMILNCVFYWLYSIPRLSSFKSSKQDWGYHGGEIPDNMFILGPLESCLHTLNLLFFPLVFHIASHCRIVFSSAATISDLFLLFFIPFLLQLYASTRNALWWVTKDQGQLRSIRIMNGAIALVLVVICLEVRVVFQSFGRYIQLPTPLNYFLVTTSMLGGIAAACAYALDMVADASSSLFFTAIAFIVSAAGALVVGFPVWMLPLPAATGFYLARYLTKKSLISYFVFVILGSMSFMWFVRHNFWDLNIWLAGMSLKSFCKLIVASVVLALSIPGLTMFPQKFKFLIEASLISHAVLLCHIENKFFNYSSIFYYGLEDDVMYPSYMVFMTTLVGLTLMRKLLVDGRIRPKAAWILACLYSAKLAMLFITSKSVVWLSALLLLAISPPLLLYKDKSKTTPKMKPWQGYAHVTIVATSVWVCRETIFEAHQWLAGRPPSDGLLLGSCVVLIGVACIPIVAFHFSHVMASKRWLLLVLVMGLLLAFMQPPIPLSWGYRSNFIKSARMSGDDISIYGFVTVKPTWPSWILISAIMLTLAGVTSVIPIKYIVELRALYAIAIGIALGVYISADDFFQTMVLQVLIIVTMICSSVLVIFTYFPSASSMKLLPWVFALLVALFPVTYLMEGQLRVKNIVDSGVAGDTAEEDTKRTTLLAIEGTRTFLLGLYATIFMILALEIKFELASMMHEKTVERGGARPYQSKKSSIPSFLPKVRFMQQRRATAVPAFTIKRIAAEGAWMPSAGNVATVLCFAICLILTGGSNRSIFLLAPILLLLNQDSEFIAGFSDKQRYFPVTVVISIYLILMALYSIWEELWHGNPGWGLEIGGADWFFAVKNVALLILTLPSHILFNQFVWSCTQQKGYAPLLTLPLNLPSVIITDVIKVKILGLLGVIYPLAQYLISRRQHISGQKYI